MLENFIFSLNIVLPMILIVFLGIYLKKTSFINKPFLLIANKLVFYIGIPSLLFTSISNSDISEIFNLEYSLFISIWTLTAFFASWGITYLVFRKKAPSVISAFVQGTYRGNVAILALPILFNLIGEENAGKGAMAIAILIPIYNVVSILLLSVHSEKNKGISFKKMALGIIKNPPIQGVFAGIVISLLGINLPPFATTTISSLAQITTPLALMCLGGSMTFEGFGSRFRYSLASSIVKVFVMPAIVTLVGYMYGFRGNDLIILTILHGVPSAVAGYVMVVEIGGDTYVASTNVLISTIMSAFSLTILIFVLRTIGIG